MIDLKTLAEEEKNHIAGIERFSGNSGIVDLLKDRTETIRFAMRYLALREHGVIADLKPDAEWLFAGGLDKAADRMIQEMLK